MLSLFGMNHSLLYYIFLQYIGCSTFGILIFLALGIVFLILGAASQEVLDNFCAGKNDNYRALSSLREEIVSIDNKMRNYTADYYCTADCPCPLSNGVNYFNEKYDETYLNDYNRTYMSKAGKNPIV